MENQTVFPPDIRIFLLRRQIEEAYDRGDLPQALALSRRMDEIMLDCWKNQAAG